MKQSFEWYQDIWSSPSHNTNQASKSYLKQGRNMFSKSRLHIFDVNVIKNCPNKWFKTPMFIRYFLASLISCPEFKKPKILCWFKFSYRLFYQHSLLKFWFQALLGKPHKTSFFPSYKFNLQWANSRPTKALVP